MRRQPEDENFRFPSDPRVEIRYICEFKGTLLEPKAGILICYYG